MNFRNLLLILISAFLLSGFTPQKKSIVGLYGECGDGYYSCTQLELKSDSTFEYYVFFDVGGGNIKKGTWKVNEDTLILNTYNQPKYAKCYKIIDSTYNETKEICCYSREGYQLYLGSVIINGLDTVNLDEKGKATYVGEIKKIEIHIFWKDYISSFFISENFSKIEFFVDNFVCHSPSYMTNEKFLIDGNEIKEYYYCHGKYADKGLKKTSIKNKAF